MVRNPSVVDVCDANIQAIWQYQVKCVAFNISWSANLLSEVKRVNKGKKVLDQQVWLTTNMEVS